MLSKRATPIQHIGVDCCVGNPAHLVWQQHLKQPIKTKQKRHTRIYMHPHAHTHTHIPTTQTHTYTQDKNPERQTKTSKRALVNSRKLSTSENKAYAVLSSYRDLDRMEATTTKKQKRQHTSSAGACWGTRTRRALQIAGRVVICYRVRGREGCTV